MESAKVAITLKQETLVSLDRLVRERVFPNRSRAIQIAVDEKLAKLKRTRLARECAKLDSREEQKMAEEWLASEIEQWPEY